MNIGTFSHDNWLSEIRLFYRIKSEYNNTGHIYSFSFTANLLVFWWTLEPNPNTATSTNAIRGNVVQYWIHPSLAPYFVNEEVEVQLPGAPGMCYSQDDNKSATYDIIQHMILDNISHRPYICEFSSICENKPNEHFPW